MENKVLKPEKKVFFIFKIFYYFLTIIFFWVLILAFLKYFQILDKNILNFLIFWFFALLIFSFYYTEISYKKEEYIFENKKIIYNNWTIFSDNSVDLEIKKITQVSLILPFLENKIFWTWKIIIKNAWTNSEKIVLSNIKNPVKIYEKIQELMRENGFHLRKDKLVQEAKPSVLWVFWELFSRFFWVFIFFVYFLTPFIFSLNKNEVGNLTKNANLNFVYFNIFIGIFLFLGILYFLIVFLDLKRRKYELFTDSIFYTNWFLTKVFSFLPIEKISDIDNKQSFFSKIFGLHDIIVSSEWSNNQVYFSNMLNWETFLKNIVYLKDSITLTKKDIVDKKQENEIVWFSDKTEKFEDFDRDFTQKYSIDLFRNIFSWFFLWIVLFFSFGFYFSDLYIWILLFLISVIFSLIKAFFEVKFTDFIVDKNTIESRYSFLANIHKTFTIEKITSVNFSESIIDKIFKTCSITFFSIWWGETIVFKNIKKTENLYENILKKTWYKKSEKLKKLLIDFSFKNMLLNNIYTIFIVILFFVLFLFFIFAWLLDDFIFYDYIFVIFAVLFFIFILSIIWFYFYYKYFFKDENYAFYIYENFLKFKEWIIVKTEKYAFKKNIKWITSTKIPLCQTWNLNMEIAWDVVFSWEKWQKSFTFNVLNISYIKNIFMVHDFSDSLLNKKEISRENILDWNQKFSNQIPFIFVLFLISLSGIISWKIEIIVLFLIIFILSFIILFIYIKNIFYVLEKDRIIKYFWIIRKSKKTIILEKINFVEKNQGFLWKIFKNWNVKIYTTWGLVVDFSIVDNEKYKEFYEKIKK